MNHPNVFITKIMDCEYIYNFITENRKSILVNGHIYPTLGHNIKGENISHTYFGSNKVIDDLKKINGWSQGFIDLTKGMFHRINGVVASIE